MHYLENNVSYYFVFMVNLFYSDISKEMVTCKQRWRQFKHEYLKILILQVVIVHFWLVTYGHEFSLCTVMLCCASRHLTTQWCKPEPEHIVLHGKHINKSVLWPQKEVPCIESIPHILPHSCTLFTWMWVVITSSSPSLATDN